MTHNNADAHQRGLQSGPNPCVVICYVVFWLFPLKPKLRHFEANPFAYHDEKNGPLHRGHFINVADIRTPAVINIIIIAAIIDNLSEPNNSCSVATDGTYNNIRNNPKFLLLRIFLAPLICTRVGSL